MNKVININFQGRILPIEESAYEMLKQYIESLRVYFENEEGRDEIINDIECRIAELCEDRLKKGDTCITESAIQLVISSIGRPADFEAQDGFEKAASDQEENFNSSFAWESTSQKRLYRDEQNKVLGGVCSGIANYFAIDPLIVRILWIFLIGVNILAYVILWIAVPSSSVKEVGGVRKRLFRDIDNKIIGGVCAGLSKYFGIRMGIVRLLFLIPFIRFIFNFEHLHLFQFWDSPDFPNFFDITFSPGAVFVYIVLWLVLPEAKTSADKLEMVGEKVDLNSIKNTIQNDMEGFSKRAQSWGSNFSSRTRERRAQRKNQDNVASEDRGGCFHFIGKLLTIVVKVIFYTFLGIILISLLAALFGIGVAGTSLLPLKGFILENGAQSWAAYGTILLFIWVPILAIVTAIIRKLAGFKKANVWVRSGFISLWVLGWICLFYFFSSLGNSFSKHNTPIEQSISLSNPKVEFLELSAKPKMKYYEDRWFHIEGINDFDGIGDADTLYVRNLRVRIIQAKTDSFEIKLVKLSNGKTVNEANKLANNINFEITQKDSLLQLDRGIAINKQDKFRNQHLILTIAVPVGKRIKINNEGWKQVNVKVGRSGMRSETINGFVDGWYDEWNEPWDNESYNFEKGVEYRMTATGLEKLKRADNDDNKDDQDSPSDIEQKLQELKQEREALKKMKATTSIEVSKIPSKITEMHWVLDRFLR
jgi:phage shock protein PspC (stress-responsive transcriptional regulator)